MVVLAVERNLPKHVCTLQCSDILWIEDFASPTLVNIDELGEKLSIRFNEFCKDYGSELTLVFEPGKYLVSEAGYFVSKVNSVKQTTSTVFAQVESGFNHLMRPMFYGSYHEIENLSNPLKICLQINLLI